MPWGEALGGGGGGLRRGGGVGGGKRAKKLLCGEPTQRRGRGAEPSPSGCRWLVLGGAAGTRRLGGAGGFAGGSAGSRRGKLCGEGAVSAGEGARRGAARGGTGELASAGKCRKGNRAPAPRFGGTGSPELDPAGRRAQSTETQTYIYRSIYTYACVRLGVN